MAKKTKKRVISRLRPLYQRTFIKQWREYRGKSQQVLADEVGAYLAEKGIRLKGYTHASIGRLENGVMPYKQHIMDAIADALDVTIVTLITRPPPKDRGQPDPDNEFREIWDKAEPDDRVKFVEILKTITKKTGSGG